MDEQIITANDVVLVRWNRMTINGVERVDAATEKVKADTGAVYYFAVVSPDCPIPGEDVRRRMSQGLDKMTTLCAAVSLIFEGKGLKMAALRSVAASVFLIHGNRKMHMYDTLDNALIEQMPARAEAITKLAREALIIR